MSIFNRIKELQQRAVNQVNPFDGGKSWSSSVNAQPSRGYSGIPVQVASPAPIQQNVSWRGSRPIVGQGSFGGPVFGASLNYQERRAVGPQLSKINSSMINTNLQAPIDNGAVYFNPQETDGDPQRTAWGGRFNMQDTSVGPPSPLERLRSRYGRI